MGLLNATDLKSLLASSLLKSLLEVPLELKGAPASEKPI
jgi:hypothetical protein